MVSKETKHARRAAIKRAERRRIWMKASAGIIGAAVVGVAAFGLLGGGDGNSSVEAAPAFELPSSDGEPVSLDDYRGQPVAVMFMHTW